MHKSWLSPLSQGLEAMVTRYSMATLTRDEIPHFRSHDERMLFLSRESIKGYFFKNLSEEVRRDGHTRLTDPCAITEFAWLMFFLKDWERLSTCIHENACIHALPNHIADLYFLSAYRLNRDRIAQGTDHHGFNEAISETLRFIRKNWPTEIKRADLFSAILQSSLGEWQEARKKIIQFSVGLELIPPLAAAKSTLQYCRDEGDISFQLEVFPTRSARATIVSVDESYYNKYSRAFLAIHSITNPDRIVHFHCVGFDPREIPCIGKNNEEIGYTIDRTSISELSQRNKNGYYACARFMHAALYLEIYEDILISDVDGSVNESVSDILEGFSEYDVILSSKILQKNRTLFNMPWSSINAAANIIRNSRGGILFAQYLRNYISAILSSARQNERPMWFADQSALFYG